VVVAQARGETGLVDEMKRSGLVARELAASGQSASLVAP